MKGLTRAKCVWVCCSNNVTRKQNQLYAVCLTVFRTGDLNQRKIQETRFVTLMQNRSSV